MFSNIRSQNYKTETTWAIVGEVRVSGFRCLSLSLRFSRKSKVKSQNYKVQSQKSKVKSKKAINENRTTNNEQRKPKNENPTTV